MAHFFGKTEKTFLKDGSKRIETTDFQNGVAISGKLDIYKQNEKGNYKLVRTATKVYSNKAAFVLESF